MAYIQLHFTEGNSELAFVESYSWHKLVVTGKSSSVTSEKVSFRLGMPSPQSSVESEEFLLLRGCGRVDCVCFVSFPVPATVLAHRGHSINNC